MLDLTPFKNVYLQERKISLWNDEILNKYIGKFSDEIIQFLSQEGEVTYGDDFFWTVLPDDYHNILNDWGIEGQKCYTFLRTSFGSLIYYYESEYYSLNPYDGSLTEFSDDFDLLMTGYFTASLIYDSTLWYEHHKRAKLSLSILKEDEIYAFNPTIPEGGSPETSKLEVVKLKEHLHKLAELHDHTATEE